MPPSRRLADNRLPRPRAVTRRARTGVMARVAARVTDKRVLKLIRAFLKAGVMEDGLVSPVDEGTPQGGPLSPLLSNLVLDDLDKELTRRGHSGGPSPYSDPRYGPDGSGRHGAANADHLRCRDR